MAAGMMIEGQHWTLWSKRGEKGSAAPEDAGPVLDGKAGHNSSQHNLGFGTCALGKLVDITDSMGSWSGP
jgi:hypothetical protein